MWSRRLEFKDSVRGCARGQLVCIVHTWGVDAARTSWNMPVFLRNSRVFNIHPPHSVQVIQSENDVISCLQLARQGSFHFIASSALSLSQILEAIVPMVLG